MALIDKETIRKKIEFAKSVYSNPKRVVHGVADAFRQDGRAAMCDDILKKLDTLPEQTVEKTSYDTQKYSPSSSVSIEDVARVQFASHAKILDKKRKAVFDWEQFKEVVGIFYGFGKKDSPETKEKEQPVECLSWHSIEESLPERKGWYFTCINDNGTPQALGVTYFDGKEWTDDDDSTENVDYWMPCPKIPKE